MKNQEETFEGCSINDGVKFLMVLKNILFGLTLCAVLMYAVAYGCKRQENINTSLMELSNKLN